MSESKGRCFVIQPFDGGDFDRRFDGVLVPAIKKAGLEAYRVDRDPSVQIPIREIEQGIKDALICLADITSDNPNVWFELGFTFAVPKDVVLICSKERGDRFPFDIQHISVIRYATGSRQDFDDLEQQIAERLQATIEKTKRLGTLSKLSPVPDTDGLSPHEVVALVTVMESGITNADGLVSAWTVREEMEKAGYTAIAVAIAVEMLCGKGILRRGKDSDWNGNDFTAYAVTDSGRRWLIANQDRLNLTYKRPEPKPTGGDEDDLPF